MGLLCEVSIDNFVGSIESETPELGIHINYAPAFRVFRQVFLQTARTLVPVDTGNLLMSIAAYGSADGVTCEADCEYAQYVEYGTYKMEAQPYFEPALMEAGEITEELMTNIYEDAVAREEEILAMMEENPATEIPSSVGASEITMMVISSLLNDVGESDSYSASPGLGYARDIGESIGNYAMISAWEGGASWMGGTLAGCAAGGLAFLALAPIFEGMTLETKHKPGKGEIWVRGFSENVGSYAMASAWESGASWMGGTAIGCVAAAAVFLLLAPIIGAMFDEDTINYGCNFEFEVEIT